jgi:hypothetical protein
MNFVASTDVLTTQTKTQFLYLHVHVVDARGAVHCKWLGATDHAAKWQLFSDVLYASAIPKAIVGDVIYDFTQHIMNVYEIVFYEARSDLILSAAMRKVLRV